MEEISQFHDLLSSVAASGDESDHGPRQSTQSGGYVVRPVDYLSEEWTEFVMDIDDLAVLRHYKYTTETRGPGAFGRPRYRPAGIPAEITPLDEIRFDMPQNCYRRDWLETLCDEDKAELQAKWKPPVSLQLPPAIKK